LLYQNLKLYFYNFTLKIIEQQLKLVWLVFVFITSQGMTIGNENRFIPE
jgi:hypothetical protein